MNEVKKVGSLLASQDVGSRAEYIPLADEQVRRFFDKKKPKSLRNWLSKVNVNHVLPMMEGGAYDLNTIKRIVGDLKIIACTGAKAACLDPKEWQVEATETVYAAARVAYWQVWGNEPSEILPAMEAAEDFFERRYLKRGTLEIYTNARLLIKYLLNLSKRDFMAVIGFVDAGLTGGAFIIGGGYSPKQFLEDIAFEPVDGSLFNSRAVEVLAEETRRSVFDSGIDL